jgi:hypothetical protein
MGLKKQQTPIQPQPQAQVQPQTSQQQMMSVPIGAIIGQMMGQQQQMTDLPGLLKAIRNDQQGDANKARSLPGAEWAEGGIFANQSKMSPDILATQGNTATNQLAALGMIPGIDATKLQQANAAVGKARSQNWQAPGQIIGQTPATKDYTPVGQWQQQGPNNWNLAQDATDLFNGVNMGTAQPAMANQQAQNGLIRFGNQLLPSSLFR